MGRSHLAAIAAAAIGMATLLTHDAYAVFQSSSGTLSGEVQDYRTGYTTELWVIPSKPIVNDTAFHGGHLDIAGSSNPPDNGFVHHFDMGPNLVQVWGYNELDYNPGEWGGYANLSGTATFTETQARTVAISLSQDSSVNTVSTFTLLDSTNSPVFTKTASAGPSSIALTPGVYTLNWSRTMSEVNMLNEFFFTMGTVPEPGSGALIGMSLVLLCRRARRCRPS
jgi:hypothetical protein